jgi:hypothetical protein
LYRDLRDDGDGGVFAALRLDPHLNLERVSRYRRLRSDELPSALEIKVKTVERGKMRASEKRGDGLFDGCREYRRIFRYLVYDVISNWFEYGIKVFIFEWLEQGQSKL